MAYAQIGDRRSAIAFHQTAIVAIEGRHPNGTRSFHHGRSDWIRIRRGLHENQPAGPAARGIWCALPVFNPAIDIEYGLIVPCRVAGLGCEEIPIVLMSACPSHHIDARSPSEHLAHLQRYGTSFEVWIRFSCNLPIVPGAELLNPALD